MNYLFLELDTTEPLLEIYAPSYTTRSVSTPVTIQANEKLGTYQDIYIIDSIGNKHNLTFTHEGSFLVGELYFDGYPIGTATLHVQLKDEVDNFSKAYSHSISIVESEILTCKMELISMNNKMQLVTMKNEMVVVA